MLADAPSLAPMLCHKKALLSVCLDNSYISQETHKWQETLSCLLICTEASRRKKLNPIELWQRDPNPSRPQHINKIAPTRHSTCQIAYASIPARLFLIENELVRHIIRSTIWKKTSQ